MRGRPAWAYAKWLFAGGVVEIALVRAVAAQLHRKRIVVDRELVGVELASLALVARDPARHWHVGLDGPRRPHGDPRPNADARAVDLDVAHAHADQLAGFADPRQLAQAVEEQRLECRPLCLIALPVDMQGDRPGRTRLIVVVTTHQHGC